ncbi:MAG TPA: hypothetical protein ENN40_06365 [Candidatus Aminicenantes bacterium]|nr:hypothetical protein [Candidatus Aminicenantes bacterium]
MAHCGWFCKWCLSVTFVLVQVVVYAAALPVDQDKNLQSAIRAGNRDQVVEALASGGDDLRQKVLISPDYYLQLTARFGTSDLLRYFVEQFGLQQNKKYLSEALVTAIDNERFEAVARTLIDLGADPAHEFSGKTALGRLAYLHAGKQAKREKMLETARLLLDNGANVNLFDETMETPLMAAARNDDLGLVKLFLEHGADPHLTNKDTASAFTLARPGSAVAAALERQKEKIALNSLSQWKPEAQNSQTKDLPADQSVFAEPKSLKVMQISEAAAFGYTDRLKELLDAGVDPNSAVDSSGFTVLMQAANAEVAQLLLNAGADVRRTDKDGWNALHFAATRESSAAQINLLIQAGLDVNGRTKRGETALRLAGLLFTEKIFPAWGETLIALLVDKGADINSTDLEGHTLLHQAAFNDNAELAAVCLRHGADPDAKTAAARTPRQVAQELGSKKFLQAVQK